MADKSTILQKNSLLRALGWGATGKTEEQSQFLRQVDLLFHSADECRCPSYYELKTMVGEERQDTCRGDSGKYMYSEHSCTLLAFVVRLRSI